jgi:hypothetical protein
VFSHWVGPGGGRPPNPPPPHDSPALLGAVPDAAAHGETDRDHAEAKTNKNEQVDAGERQRTACGFTENVDAASVLIGRGTRARRECRP